MSSWARLIASVLVDHFVAAGLSRREARIAARAAARARGDRYLALLAHGPALVIALARAEKRANLKR